MSSLDSEQIPEAPRGSGDVTDGGPRRGPPGRFTGPTFWLVFLILLAGIVFIVDSSNQSVIVIDLPSEPPPEVLPVTPVTEPPPAIPVDPVTPPTLDTPPYHPIEPSSPAATAPPTTPPESPSAGSTPPASALTTPQLVKRVRPSVLFLYFKLPAGPMREQQFSGTGFLIDDRGTLVTNRHVVEKAAEEAGGEVFVRFSNGHVVPGRVTKMSRRVDLALVQIDPPPGLAPLPLGDSDDLALGEDLLILGYPLGRFGDVTVISGILGSIPPDEGLLQLSAAVNRGNSGGPVFRRSTGEVAGVVVSKESNAEAMGFAIPVNVLKSFLREGGG